MVKGWIYILFGAEATLVLFVRILLVVGILWHYYSSPAPLGRAAFMVFCIIIAVLSVRVAPARPAFCALYNRCAIRTNTARCHPWPPSISTSMCKKRRAKARQIITKRIKWLVN
jgi:hypothetical protein